MNSDFQDVSDQEDSDDYGPSDEEEEGGDREGLPSTAEGPPEFYDPEADTKSEAWVSKLRGGRGSDAILSCPLCFTTLCLECEQHAFYHNQFRAMRVMNCSIDTEHTETFEAEQGAGRPRRGSKRGLSQEAQQTPPEPSRSEETFNPVRCRACDTGVGVRSAADGTFHFTDVFASNS